MGDPNASIPTPQPVHFRPLCASFGKALGATSISFVSQASLANGAAESYGLAKQLVAVKGNRSVTKRDKVHNAYLSVMQIDAQTPASRPPSLPGHCRHRCTDQRLEAGPAPNFAEALLVLMQGACCDLL